MLRLASIPTALLAVLLVAAPVAAGEEDETRLTASGQVGHLSMDAFGTSGDAFAYGGRLALADGLNRWLEVGIDLSYLTQQNVSFSAPMVAGAAAILRSCGVAIDGIQAALTAGTLNDVDP